MLTLKGDDIQHNKYQKVPFQSLLRKLLSISAFWKNYDDQMSILDIREIGLNNNLPKLKMNYSFYIEKSFNIVSRML